MREGRRDGVTASGEAVVGHLPKGKSEAAASAARYIPKPKTVCVPRLLMELKKGLGVFHDATPAPIVDNLYDLFAHNGPRHAITSMRAR